MTSVKEIQDEVKTKHILKKQLDKDTDSIYFRIK